MKKKAVKLAAATAVAASAFVAAAPAQTDAASSVAVEVSKAVTAMKQAYHTYSDVTATGKFADINAVYADYNAAKKAYANAKALVEKSKDAKKDAYLAELEATYAEYIAKRVVTYIDAYNYATINLEANTAALNAAIEAKDAVKVEAVFHEISKQLKTRTVILDRVYGETTRDLFRNGLKKAAQDLRDSMVNDVTVGMKLRDADAAIKAGKLEEAKAALDVVAEYLPKATTFKAELEAAAAPIKAAYEALLTVEAKSAVAPNLTQVVVTFSGAVDATTAKDKTNYTLGGAALAAGDTVTLSGDAKTVTITLATTAGNQTSEDLVVKNVKSAKGQTVAEFKTSVEFKDLTVPTVDSVTSAGPAKFKVTFNEPVDLASAQTVSNYVVNDGQYFIKSATRVSLTEVEVELYSSLANGEYSVKVSNVTDLAGFKAATTTLKFNQVEDKTAPVVSKVVSASPTEVVLEMSEDVTAVNAGTIKDAIYHTNSTNKATSVDVDGKTVTVTFAEATKLPNGTAYLYLDKEILADGWGNKNAAYSTTLTVVSDTDKPTVSKVEATADNSLKVTYSEKVTEASAETAGNYTILDKDGKKVDVVITPVLAADGKTVALGLSKSLSGATYSVAVENVKDLANNTIDKATVNVAVSDSSAPTVTATGTKYTSKNIVKVSFSEAMATTGTGSVLDLANYAVGNTYLNTTKAKVSVTDEGKAVLIDLTDAVAAGELTVPSTITVGKVADVAGNFVVGFTTPVTLNEGTTFGISKVEAVDTKTVKVYLADALSKFEANDFVIESFDGVTATAITPASVVFANVDGKGVITYTLADADKLGTDGKKGAQTVRVKTVATAADINSANQFGVKVAENFAPVGATDKIAASLVKWDHDTNAATASVEDIRLTYTDGNTNGKVDTNEAVTIKLDFSEDLMAGSTSTQTFEVAGFTVTNATLDSDNSVVVLTATANANNTVVAASTTTVKQVANLLDENGVLVVSGGNWTVSKVN